VVVLVVSVLEGVEDELDEFCPWVPDELCCDWPCGCGDGCEVDEEVTTSSARDAATGMKRNAPERNAARATSLGILRRQSELSSLSNFGDIYTLK
jgi:hypothetical protein